MRYNPDTDRAVYNERVQAESQEKFRARSQVAQVTPVTPPVDPLPIKWAEIERSHYAGARITGYVNCTLMTCCDLSHGIEVAQAMGNWAEARRLRAQLIAGIW